jgi:hypothetical protein
MATTTHFTAARIAAALGQPAQAIRAALASIKSGIVLVRGKETAAWSLEQLPKALRDELEAAARRQCYRNAETLLADATAEWRPAVPLAEMADAEIERANKLRLALAPILLRRHADLPAAELEALGVVEYSRAFGHPVSTRHWRTLFKRTLDRDAGADDFGRIELYVSDKPARKSAGQRIVCEAIEELSDQFPAIEDFIFACGNPAAPDEIELRGIWTLVFEEYDRLVKHGTKPKRAARRLRDFIFRKADFLAPSRNALRMAFDRKLERWNEGERSPAALQDRRKDNGAEFGLPEEDRDKLIHRAVFNYRGDIAPAWRDLLNEGFSGTVRERYAGKSFKKSHVPASVMDSVVPEVEILTVLHQGPRAFDAIKGHVTRSYEGIASLRCMSADDFTLNTYFYVPDGKGWFNLTRGQTILFIDFRSLRILGWALEPRASYSSMTIRSLCTHIFSEFGLPDVLYFERGIWKNAALLKGKKDPFTFAQISQGLREFGITFKHAIRPRTKVVERIGGMFQDIAEAEPGYCGRDERHDAPESLRKQMAEVETRKVHPEKYFLSYEQWNRRIRELAARYNAEPQQGKILAGLSPDQAFEMFLDRDNPPNQFPACMRYLFAHDKRIARVTLNGVTVQVGKKSFNYRGKEIAHLVGREVLAWFDPENPEALVVTDLDRQNPVVVARSQETSALECLTGADNLGAELARIEGQASYMKTRFNVLRTKFPLPARKLLFDANTREQLAFGQHIETKKQELQDRADSHRKNIRRAHRLAADTGIILPERAIDRADPDAGKEVRAFLNRKKTPVLDPAPEGGKTYILKSSTSKTPESAHVDYLLNRLTEFRKAGQKSFAGPISIHATARIALSQLGCDLYAPEHFEKVCAYLQEKIDATALGKCNSAAVPPIPNYHSFYQEIKP